MGLKILHTADWHLGKKLDNFSRIDEQREVLDEICEIAEREAVDLVLVAGDLFDTFNPPVEAVELFYKTLKRLAKNGERPVIAIAGNHDSPERIDAPDPLARECGIILIGLPNAEVTPFEIENQFKVSKSANGLLELRLDRFKQPIRILHTPYANEIRLKKALDTEDKGTALNEALGESWQALADKYCKTKGVNLLISHLYMMNRNGEILEEPDGEKPLKVGNADIIYSDIIPEQVQYTALGHLHRAHQIGEEERPVVYSGSPLSYSFSEAGQQKYVMLLEAEAAKPITYTKIALEKGRPLSRMKFMSVDEAVEWLTANPTHLVELTIVSDTFLNADDIKRLYTAHDGIITIIPQVTLSDKGEQDKVKQVNLEQDMQGLFKDYFKQKYKGQEPNEELMDLFNEILN
ncbi:exonuclease subunit SbcD [Myroides marinus]|uniref:metallophosphoesterase family protein n=1 Tax=Myroides marinus TaxID=703342 RepID=UPI002578BE18|nr:exonuclease subunit SbcD [Myroides marinus]MDM1362552.1 exonuclease subunit SbcD [Myroides marinus]MDM1373004.1 exonuclease subunit SbcD [Myroides marinus]MDM1376638.1 exonuclease subunit SbcD [Myroides marinus]MDM1380335.1 exonuclease subunit SbcD [Myroides marinus]MDM1387607.1 exonuclease subunit SbcD [Myroides marinus]